MTPEGLCDPPSSFEARFRGRLRMGTD